MAPASARECAGGSHSFVALSEMSTPIVVRKIVELPIIRLARDIEPLFREGLNLCDRKIHNST